MAITIVTVIILLSSLYLFKQAAGTVSVLRLNTVSYVFYFQILIMAVVGSVFVANNLVDYHYMISPVSDKVKVYAWIGVMYSIIAMPLGMILLNNILKIKNIKGKHQDYINQDIEYSLSRNNQNHVLFFFLVFTIIILTYILFSNDTIPIVELLKGNKEAAAIGRITVRLHFGGIGYIKNLLGLVLIPIFSYYSFILWQKDKSLFRFSIMIIQNILTIILLIYDTQKAPFIFFLMGYLIVLTYTKGGISWKTLLLFFSTGIALLVLGYSITRGRGFEQLLDPTSGLYGRLFISGYGGYVLSLQFFPDIIKDSTIFIGIPHAILEFFSLPSTESARLLMQHINPDGVKNGTANLISSFYLGEAYANYGISGLLAAPIIVGFVIQSVHIFLIQSSKQPIYISIYAFITVKWLLNAGFVSFLYLKIILFPLVLITLVKLFLNIFSKRSI